MSSFPVFLVSCLIFGAQSTKFDLELIINCVNHPVWHFEAKFLEKDTLDATQDIAIEKNITVRSPMYSQFTTKNIDGDGLADNYYEIHAYVVHNCSDSGKVLAAVFEFPDISVKKTIASVRLNATLDNLGYNI